MSINDWVKRIGVKPIPVLNDTITDLRRVIAKPNARISEIVAVVERDPGLTVYVLRIMNSKQRSSMSSVVTSVQQALMMMGTDQLNELPQRLPQLEQTLQDPARTRLLKTFMRTYHAARQALAWAMQRRDMTPDEVFAATQLHFIGEMGLAIHAPEMLDEIDQLCIEKHIPSEEAQYIKLGFTLDDLTLQLAQQWQLPALVSEALHAENAKFPRAYGVMLAVQLGRHAAIDWYGAKTRSIQANAAEWLDVDTDDIVRQTHVLAVEVARDAYKVYKVTPAACCLPMLHMAPAGESRPTEASTPQAPEAVDICLMPQPALIKKLLMQLNHPDIHKYDAQQIMNVVVQGIHHGLGMNRVVYARLDEAKRRLLADKIVGSNNDPIFSRFEIGLKEPSLFSMLMEKNQAVLINDGNRHKLWSLVPQDFQKKINVNSFVAMSIYIDNQPVGLMYADRHSNNCQLDETSYNYFKTICNQVIKTLSRRSA